MMYFLDRSDAGRKLADALVRWKGREDAIVLALPRGGVSVAFEVASALDLPLDILLVRKLGVPGRAELAMGAIAEGGIEVINRDIVRQLNIPPDAVAAVAAREQVELKRRIAVYREARKPPSIEGRAVILVDDGCATGANMRAAIEASRAVGACYVVVAVPVASFQANVILQGLADEVVSLSVPTPFLGVGHFYLDFTQVADTQVEALLTRSGLMNPDHLRVRG